MMLYLDWKRLLFIPLGICCFFALSFGQKDGTIEKSLQFNGENVEKMIQVDVTNAAHSLSATLNGEITTGSLNVSIIDPKGNRRNGFSLQCGDAGSSEYEIKTSSGGSVVNVVKSGSGSNEISTVSEEGSSSVVISTGSGSGSSFIVETSNDKVKIKDKSKGKAKSKGSNSNSNSDEEDNSVFVTSTDQSGAKGVFVESIDDPTPGIWKIMVEGKSVKGELEVTIHQNK